MKYEIIKVGRLQTNCIILWDNQTLEAAVIDPGDDSIKILNKINDYNLYVSRILLTHQHHDHIGAVTALLKHLPNNPRIMMGALEYSLMKSALRHPEVDRNFELHDPADGKTFKIGNVESYTITVPGHTDDSVCYYFPEEKLVIAGDTLFYHAIGIHNYYSGAPTDLGKYIRDRLFVLPDDTVVIPGHDRLTTIGEEKKHNPYIPK